MVHNTIPIIRRSIERIELHWISSGIDDIMIRSGRDKHGKTRADFRADAIENSDTLPFLYSEELIELVDFHPDILSGLQRHDNELTVFSCIQYLAKVLITDADLLDVIYKTFHSISFACFLLAASINEK
jgi:hypothetical protein